MEQEQPSSQRSIQDYLSLGYLFLLLLGIARDIIYYRFLEIDILKYSNITDILLSPLNYLATKLPAVLTLSILIFIIYQLHFPTSSFHTRFKETDWHKKLFKPKDFNNTALFEGFFFVVGILMFGFFVGTGIGSGTRMSEKLETKDFEVDYQLIFQTGEIIDTKVLGHNSEYIFYITPPDTAITISPIKSNLKKMVRLPEK